MQAIARITVAVGLLAGVLAACGSEGSALISESGAPDASTDVGNVLPFDDGGSGRDAGADASDGGPTNASGCSGTQTKCNGVCVSTTVDPNNCGSCGKVCPQGQVCFSSSCVGSCPGPFTNCSQMCVDTSLDNANCGACGRKCPAGQGCVGGSCVPGVQLGPPPAKCAGGGPPIVVQGGPTPTCTGKIAQVSFTHALCSCSDIGVPILSSDSFFDAFDSKQGPYVPNGLGGSVGANGTLQMSSQFRVYGDLRTAGANNLAGNNVGFTVGGATTVHQQLHAGAKLQLDNTLNVTRDARVAGPITGSSNGSIGGTLFTPNCGGVPSNLTRAACTSTAVTVPEPCACKPNEIVPVSAMVAFYASSANNDNALIGLNPAVFDAPGAPSRIDLPCGYYYLNQVNPGGSLVVAVHGPTALFIGGSIQVASSITFTLDPGATLDVFVGGAVVATAQFRVGSRAYPAGSRFYVGGTCKGASAICKLNADCCSNTCTSGQCVGAGITPPFGVNLTSNTELNGLFYSANASSNAGFRTSSDLEMYGAVFAGYYHSTSNTKIHYDRAATTLADECPPTTSGGGDGGSSGADGGGGGGGGPCGSCRDCGNQACINGQCSSCTNNADCCAPLYCINGKCEPPPIK